MKALHVYKSYYPETTGGVEQVIHQLCRELPKHGVKADVAVGSTPQTDVFKSDYAVFRYSNTVTFASCPMSMPFLTHFESLTRTYDLIHYHFPWPFADIMHLATKSKKPYIITYHSDIVKQRLLKIPYEPLMHRFLSHAQAIVATSPHYIQSSPVLQAHIDKVTAIPLGMAQSDCPVAEPLLLKQWEAQLGKDFFLFIGVLRYYKGVEFLLQAARHTQAHIVIAGTGPEEARYKAIAKQLALKNVTFLGYVPDLDKAALLTLCRAVVAPSHLRSEAFCLSLLEGLCYHKPAISTDIGTGTSFINQQGKTGIVVPPADPGALAQAINTLHLQDDYYRRLQSNIRAHYLADFTAEMMAERYVNIYKTLS